MAPGPENRLCVCMCVFLYTWVIKRRFLQRRLTRSLWTEVQFSESKNVATVFRDRKRIMVDRFYAPRDQSSILQRTVRHRRGWTNNERQKEGDADSWRVVAPSWQCRTARLTQDLLVSFGWDSVIHPPYWTWRYRITIFSISLKSFRADEGLQMTTKRSREFSKNCGTECIQKLVPRLVLTSTAVI